MSDNLRDLIGTKGLGALATIKRDGRPQLSNVSYSFDQPNSLIRVSTTEGRAKTANLRRDPRASLYVPSAGLATYAVAEGSVALSEVAQHPDDDAVAELVELYRLIQGEHPDWAEYRQAMVDDTRLVVRLTVERIYGFAP